MWPAITAVAPSGLTDFPPLLSASEIAAYAEQRLTASDEAEVDFLEKFLSLDLQGASREQIESFAYRLSDLERHDTDVELRKWRAIRLEEVLETIPDDPIYGSIALTEFWQEFGFPPDSPHEVQGKDSSFDPSEYYRPENWTRLLNIHRVWLKNEIEVIQGQDVPV
jgi:hypothetical protein